MRRATFLAFVVLLGAIAATVPSSSTPATAAPPTVVSATNPNSVSLTSPGLFVVQSITIPKGTWTLVGKASVINAGTSGDFFRCQLVDTTHATALDGATTFLNPSIPYDVVTNLAVFTATGRVTITQECGHDGTAGNAGGFVDGESNLVAFAATPQRVRVATAGAQTDLPSGVNKGVLTLTLPPGAWVVLAKVTPVVLSAASVQVVCSDEAVNGGAQRELGTSSGLHAASTIFDAGELKAAKRKTVHLNCTAAGSGAYIDPGAVLFAWKATTVKRASSSTCPVDGTTAAATDALVLTQTGQCLLAPGTRSSPLAHAQLQPGTWVALGGAFDIASQGLNIGRCELYEPKQMLLLDSSGASMSAVAGYPITGLANLAVVKTTRARAVDADCGEDREGATGFSTGASWVFVKP
ncbi:MAG TPA: hypothetical protein VH914_12855 [Acidimicrobiia bacterium]|nr:hypothetical protein [Acidimicrobiia bacterium]